MDESPLLKLPAEMRNRIYERASRKSGSIQVQLNRSVQRAVNVPIALTTTCQQIRAKTAALFFHANTFTIRTHYLDYCDLQTERPPAYLLETVIEAAKWLNMVGYENIRRAEYFTLDLGVFHMGPDT